MLSGDLWRRAWFGLVNVLGKHVDPPDAARVELILQQPAVRPFQVEGPGIRAVVGRWIKVQSIIAQGHDEVEAARRDAVSLDLSFRTHAGLVGTANRVFAALLGPLHVPLSAERDGGPGPSIEAWQLEETRPKARTRAAEAAHLAARVRALLDGPATVHEAGGGSLLDTPEARDGLALLAAVALHDPAALVTTLRSPLCGVSDAAIADLARTRDEDDDWFRALECSADQRLGRAQELFRELQRRCRSEPPSTLLQWANRLTGYTAVLANLWNAGRRLADWRGLTELVRELERGSDETFSVVLALRETLRAGVDVPRPVLEAGDAVVLSTMHSSKGLEWPVVIVADLGWSAPHGAGDVLVDSELGVGLRQGDEPTVAWTLIAARRRAREEAEARRLLYVALTRARDAVVLSASGPAGPGSLLELLTPGLQAAGVELREVATPELDTRRATWPDPAPAPLPTVLWPDPVDLQTLDGDLGSFHLMWNVSELP